jgi:hypothetical protein
MTSSMTAASRPSSERAATCRSARPCRARHDGEVAIDGHTDQVVIWGSLILGLWLIANSLYLVLS